MRGFKSFSAAVLFLTGFVITGLFAEEPPAELVYTPQVPEVAGEGSLVVVRGNVDGEAFSVTWDFSQKGPVTNGLMSTQISSTVPGTVSLYFDNGYHPVHNPQKPNDWYLRFTLGNGGPGFRFYNAKETFSIPRGPYSMITLRKGPPGSPQYKHREYNEDNLMTITVTDFAYDEEARTLRLKGGLKSTWGDDWVTADFNVLIGGPDDRQASLNQSAFGHSY